MRTSASGRNRPFLSITSERQLIAFFAPNAASPVPAQFPPSDEGFAQFATGNGSGYPKTDRESAHAASRERSCYDEVTVAD